MRITGGQLGGRILKVPKSDAIRPTQDRVRESVFNIIQFEIAGKEFLDLFAGSGAVGIEALSRGAAGATFVEQDRRHLAVLRENLKAMGLSNGKPDPREGARVTMGMAGDASPREGARVTMGDGARVTMGDGVRDAMGMQGNVTRAPSRGVSVVAGEVYRWLASYSGPGFDIAFADPPYALGEERGYASVLATLAERGVVRRGGLFIAEMTAVQKSEETSGWDLLRDRTYGKTRICIWRRAEEIREQP